MRSKKVPIFIPEMRNYVTYDLNYGVTTSR